MTPSWYLPFDPDNAGVQEAAGRAAKSLPRPPQRRGEDTPRRTAWSISQDEINSFLAVITAPPPPPMTPAPASDPAPGRLRPLRRLHQGPGHGLPPADQNSPSGDPQGGVGSPTFSVGIVRDAGGQPMGLVKLTNVWAGYLPLPLSAVEAPLHWLLPTIIDAVQNIARVQFGVEDGTSRRRWCCRSPRASSRENRFPCNI